MTNNFTTIDPAASLLGTVPGELAFRVRGGEHSGRIVRLRSSKCTIGSAPESTLRLQAQGVSPLHCLVVRGEGGVMVRRWAADTQLNGRAFTDSVLAAGDRLQVGPIELEVLDENGPPIERRAKSSTAARAVQSTATASTAAPIDLVQHVRKELERERLRRAARVWKRKVAALRKRLLNANRLRRRALAQRTKLRTEAAVRYEALESQLRSERETCVSLRRELESKPAFSPIAPLAPIVPQSLIAPISQEDTREADAWRTRFQELQTELEEFRRLNVKLEQELASQKKLNDTAGDQRDASYQREAKRQAALCAALEQERAGVLADLERCTAELELKTREIERLSHECSDRTAALAARESEAKEAAEIAQRRIATLESLVGSFETELRESHAVDASATDSANLQLRLTELEAELTRLSEELRAERTRTEELQSLREQSLKDVSERDDLLAALRNEIVAQTAAWETERQKLQAAIEQAATVPPAAAPPTNEADEASIAAAQAELNDERERWLCERRAWEAKLHERERMLEEREAESQAAVAPQPSVWSDQSAVESRPSHEANEANENPIPAASVDESPNNEQPTYESPPSEVAQYDSCVDPNKFLRSDDVSASQDDEEQSADPIPGDDLLGFYSPRNRGSRTVSFGQSGLSRTVSRPFQQPAEETSSHDEFAELERTIDPSQTHVTGSMADILARLSAAGIYKGNQPAGSEPTHESPEVDRASEIRDEYEGDENLPAEETTHDQSIAQEAPAEIAPPAPIPASDTMPSWKEEAMRRLEMEAKNEPEPIKEVPRRAPDPVPQPAAQASAPADDDDAINDYMNRLMKRVRGDSVAETFSAKAATPAAETKSAPVAKHEEAAPQRVLDPVKPEEFIPRSQAPEARSHLNAMRDIALHSTRQAVEKSQLKQFRQARLGKTLGAAVGFSTGLLMLFWASRVQGLVAYAGALVAFVAGSHWLLEIRKLRKPTRQEIEFSSARPVAAAVPTPAPVVRQPITVTDIQEAIVDSTISPPA